MPRAKVQFSFLGMDLDVPLSHHGHRRRARIVRLVLFPGYVLCKLASVQYVTPKPRDTQRSDFCVDWCIRRVLRGKGRKREFGTPLTLLAVVDSAGRGDLKAGVSITDVLAQLVLEVCVKQQFYSFATSSPPLPSTSFPPFPFYGPFPVCGPFLFVPPFYTFSTRVASSR